MSEYITLERMFNRTDKEAARDFLKEVIEKRELFEKAQGKEAIEKLIRSLRRQCEEAE